MGRPADPARRVAVWVLVVQCLLALSWTLYVLFLPQLLAAAGIERRWFVYVLIADQAIFAACDRAAGVAADRIAPGRRRVGRAIGAVTLLSSVALMAMPWLATRGAVPLLAVIFLWAATSSALRAPVFALLGRVRDASPDDGPTRAHPAVVGRSGTIGIALVGISLAGAASPYLTLLLKGIAPQLPIAVSALALAAAGLWAVRVEAHLPRVPAPPTPAPSAVRQRGWALAVVVLVATFGTQVATAIVATPLLQRFVGADAMLWIAWFWAGFGLGLVPGTWSTSRARTVRRALLDAVLALLIAAALFGLGTASPSVALLAVALTLTGAAWGAFTTILFATAVALSDGRGTVRGAGTASGLLFSAIAVGTLLRMAFVATGLHQAPFRDWLPQAAWLAAGGVLLLAVRTLWRESPQR